MCQQTPDEQADRAPAVCDGAYARIPELECPWPSARRVCGPISVSELEAERVLAAAELDTLPLVDPETGVCPFLTVDGQCDVYEARPLICRLYGAAEGLECPHGCRPHRYLTFREAAGLIRQVDAGGTVATYPHPRPGGAP